MTRLVQMQQIESGQRIEPLLALWMKTMSRADVSAERLERLRHAYANDVAVLPPASIAAIIADAGFELPTLFHQAGLIHAWFSRRAPAVVGSASSRG